VDSRKLPDTVVLLLKIQICLAAILAVIACLLSLRIGMSVAIGGLIALVAQCVFAVLAFQHRGARAAAFIARGFARGAIAKMILTAGLCVTALLGIENLVPMAMFFGLMMVAGSNWIFFLLTGRAVARS